jgi:hypothetical protein
MLSPVLDRAIQQLSEVDVRRSGLSKRDWINVEQFRDETQSSFVRRRVGLFHRCYALRSCSNIHDVPNRSRSIAKRRAKNVSSIGMKICPPSVSSV